MFHDNHIDVVNRHKLRYLGAFSSYDYNLIVCIENYDDERFWSFIFSKVEILNPKFLDFDGKNNILPFENYFDKEFVACVDSDYDYILKKSYLNNDYIFHTYVYAVENYCVCAESMNDLKDTCNIISDLDFKSLLSKIGLTLKDALLYDIYLKYSEQECQRNIFKFKNIPENTLNETFILNQLEIEVFKMLENIDREVYVSYQNTITEDIHINENYLHLYMDGHNIFDSVLDIFKKFQYKTSNIRREKVRANTLIENESSKLKEIVNKEFDIDSMLRANYKEAYHIESSSMHQIIKDIENILL